MMELFSDVKAVASILPQAKNAGALNGVAVDTEGFEDMMVVVNVGAVTGTPSAFTVNAKVQESANGSTGWADIEDAAIAEVAAIDKTGEVAVNLSSVSRLRYVRVVATPAFTGGTTPTVLLAANVLLGQSERGPVANSATPN